MLEVSSSVNKTHSSFFTVPPGVYRPGRKACIVDGNTVTSGGLFYELLIATIIFLPLFLLLFAILHLVLRVIVSVALTAFILYPIVQATCQSNHPKDFAYYYSRVVKEKMKLSSCSGNALQP